MPGNGDWTKRYATGDIWQPRAEWLNNVTKAAQAIARNMANQGQPAGRSRRPDGLVSIKNGTGADVDQYSILGFNGIVIEPGDSLSEFQTGPIFYGDIPNTGDDFVVCAEPIAKDGIGQGFLFGTTACYVDMISSSHVFAEIKDGDKTQLISCGRGSARILWCEPGAGKKWAVVQLAAAGPAGIILAMLSANAAGDEEYDAKSVTGTTTTTPETNLTAPPAGMSTAATADILFLNMGAAGASGHSLTLDTAVAGIVVGATDESPPRRIVWGFGNGGGGGSLPAPTAAYQVLQCSVFTSPTDYSLDFDTLRLT